MSLSPQQRKAIRKVTETMQEYPLGIEFSELMQKAVMSKSGLTKTLAMVSASQSTDGLWHLPQSTPAHDGGNDDGGNTQAPQVSEEAPQVSYPDESLNDAPKSPTNPNTGREYIELPETGVTIKQVIEAVAEEEFELTPPPIHQKRFVLIENCYLSLATDGTGQEPALAEDIWVDEEGEEMSEADCQFLIRAKWSYTNELVFRGVTYRNLFVAESQLFHGIFDDIQTAKDRMGELMAKKPSNTFELLEV